jgi:hypothetical protein
MALALSKGNKPGIEKVLLQRNTGNSLEVDIAAAISSLKKTYPDKIHQVSINRSLHHALMQGYGEASTGAIGELLVDTKVPQEAKALFIQVLMARDRSNGKGGGRAIEALSKALKSDSLPNAVRRTVLKDIGFAKGNSMADTLIKPYLTSSDTGLKSAAYWGIGRRIELNRAQNRSVDNDRILTGLMNASGASPDQFSVRAIAQVGTTSAESYLADRCAGDPEKLKLVFKYDPEVTNPTLISAAVSALDQPGERTSMSEALRDGLDDPDATITPLLSGSRDQILTGLRLLREFSELASKHASRITELSKSQDSEISAAALDLSKYIPSGDAKNPGGL